MFHSLSMHFGKNRKPGWRHRSTADALYPGSSGSDGIQSKTNSISNGKIYKYSRMWSPSPSSANGEDKASWKALWWLLIIRKFYIEKKLKLCSRLLFLVSYSLDISHFTTKIIVTPCYLLKWIFMSWGYGNLHFVGIINTWPFVYSYVQSIPKLGEIASLKLVAILAQC